MLPFTIRQEMTTPSKPGKAPRPVWVIDGLTDGYEDIMYEAGGKKYRGRFSFFADPTEALSRAVAEQGRASFAERQEAARQRAAERAERLAVAAENAEGRAQALDSRARQTLNMIAGQPILLDHYSARTDINRRERMHKQFRRATEEHKDAENYARRADLNERKASGEHLTPDYVQRRYDEAQAAVRKLQRQLDGRDSIYGYVMSEEDRARTSARLAEYQERADYWQAQIASIGGTEVTRPLPPKDVKPGDRVRLPYGWATVVKRNPKKIRVATDTMPYYPISITWDQVMEHHPVDAANA